MRAAPWAVVLAVAMAIPATPSAAAFTSSAERKLTVSSATLDVLVQAVSILPIAAAVDVKPETLEQRGTGGPVTVFVELPPPYRVSAIDTASVRLCMGVDPCADGLRTIGKAKVGDADGDGIVALKLTFDRTAVASLLSSVSAPAVVDLAVAGLVGGDHFVGSDSLRVVP
ncbi:MAG TPA: hypothetical protein VMQ65_04195 [Candidatus Limnocylindria bacterium]|nr:hypothetical protein [Candidatus Limnocylindria bacterium]